MTAKSKEPTVVVVGKRHYDLVRVEDGKWSVSRGGLPTGFLVSDRGKAFEVAALGEGEEAVADLRRVLDEALKSGVLG